MSDDLDQLTAAPFAWWWSDDEGRMGPFEFRPLTLQDLAVFNRIIEKYWQTPFDTVGPLLEKLPDRERAELWEKAKEQMSVWLPPSFMDIAGRATLLRTWESRQEFLEAAVRRAKPDVEATVLERIVKACGLPDLELIHALLAGMKITPDAGDPKAEAGEAPEPVTTETEEEKAKRIENEEESRKLNESWRWNLLRTVSPYAWITNPSSPTSSRSSVSRPPSSPK